MQNKNLTYIYDTYSLQGIHNMYLPYGGFMPGQQPFNPGMQPGMPGMHPGMLGAAGGMPPHQPAFPGRRTFIFNIVI